MPDKKRITVIGSDSSHIIAFIKLLNKKENNGDWQISTVIKHDKSQMPISLKRKKKIEKKIIELGVPIFSEYNLDVLRRTDAFIIGNVDAHYHKEILEKIAAFQKPVFIDKPIAYSVEETDIIYKIADNNQCPIFSSSSLRFSESFLKVQKKIEDEGKGIRHVKLKGPLPFLPEIKGLYWYGIHLVEMMESLEKGPCYLINYEDCSHQLILTYQGEHVIYTIVGDKTGESTFSGELSTDVKTYVFDIANDSEPLYTFLIQKMLLFFETRISPISKENTKNVMEIIEGTNQKLLQK